MPFEVYGPDGKSVTFPDGTDDATVVRVMGGIYPSATPAAAAPTAKTPSVDDTNIFRDVPGALVSGLGQLAKFPANVYGLTTGDFDTMASRAAQGLTDIGEDIKSEGLRERERLAQERIAAQEGFLGEAGQTIKEYATDPRLLMSGALSSLPSMVGGLGVGALAGKGVSKLAGRKAAEEVAKAKGRKAAVVGGIGAAAAEQGASVGEDTYSRVTALPEEILTQSPDYQSLLEAGTSPEDARQELALSAARKATAAATALSAVSAGLLPRAIEKTVFGDAVTDGIIKRSLKSFAGEATQEGIEEGGGQLAQNLAVSQADVTADPFKGVGAATAQGAILGGAFGAPAGAFSGRAQAAAPGQEAPPVAPEVQAEFRKLAAQQVAATMAANPNISQDEATTAVVARADVILEQAKANVEAAQTQAETGAGLDGGASGPNVAVAGAAGPSVPVAGAPTPTGQAAQTVPQAKPVGVASVGEPVGGPTGAEAGADGTLTPITGKQVTATIPTIEKAFDDNALDFEVYGVEKLNAEQKKQAARIVLQSPEVAPYDAIVSVLDRGVKARGEQVPSKTTIDINGQKRTIETAPTLTGSQQLAAELGVTGERYPALEPAYVLPKDKTTEKMRVIAPVVADIFTRVTGLDTSKLPEGDTKKAYNSSNTRILNAVLRGEAVNPETIVQEQVAQYKVPLASQAAAPTPTPTPTQTVEAEEDILAPARGEMKLAERKNTVRPLVSLFADDAIKGVKIPTGFGSADLDAVKKQATNQVANQLAKGQDVDAAAVVDTLLRNRGFAIPERATATATATAAAPEPTSVAAPEPTSVAAPTPEPEYTPQQIAEHLTYFSVPEAQSRGYEPNTDRFGMFTEGARDVANGVEPIPDQQILEGLGQEALDAYKAGIQWAQDSVAAAQAAPAKVAPVSPAKKAKQVKAVIKRKPGKTVAEKVLNMAQAEVDAMPKEDMVGQVTPYTPEYETIRAKPGINATRMAKMLGPQLYGDPTNMGQVCIKEVLQNSFDATRTAINGGQITQGEISITISKDGRTLTVKDNGIGMTPELLGGKFLEIAGTAKEGDKNAGGFGIAKMLFLYANKNIRVSTARDGRIAEMDVTGEQLFAALDDPNQAPNIEIRELEPVDQLAFPDGHGTIIQLTIPKESGDYKIKELPRYLDEIASLGLSPLFANIKVTFDGSTVRGPRTVDVGANFPAQDYTQFVGVKFPWGVAKVYVTREQTGQQYGRNMHILSNGLWQFSTDVNKDPSNMFSDPVPYRFYVDIVPSVKPDEPGYPFNFNRQNFTDDAKRDFGKIKKYIDAIYAYKSRAGEATSFGNVQYFDARGNLGPVIDLTPSIPVQDTSFTRVTVGDQITVDENGALLVNGQPMPELTPDELKAGIPSASELKIDPDLIDTNSVMVHDNADVVINATGEKLSIPDYMRRQLGVRFDEFMLYNGATFLTLRNEVARVMGYRGLRDEAIGVSFDPEYRGVSIRLPFSGSFINPLVPKYADGLRAGYGIFGTMVHELAHHRVRNHNADFPAEMQDILLNMESDTNFDFYTFKATFAEAIARDYADIIKLGVELFNGKNPDISVEYRGNRFTDGSPEQAPEGAGDSGAGDVRGPRGEGGTGESLLGPAYERRGGTGGGSKRGTGAKGSAQPVNNATVNKVAAAKLTKAQTKRLEEAAGIRRMKITGMQKRILRSRSAEETTSLMGKLMLIARNPSEDGNILTSLFNSVSGPSALQKLLGPQMTEDVVRLANALGLKNVQRIDDLMRNEYIPYVNRMVLNASQTSEKLADFLSRTELGGKALTDVVIYANMVDVDPSLAPNATEYFKLDNKLAELKAELASETDPKKRTAIQNNISTRQGEIRRAYTGGVDEQTEETVYGWNDLSRPEFGGGAGKQMFRMLRDEYRKTFDEHYRLLMARINAADLKSEDRIKLKSAVEKMFAEAKKRTIYFPLKRFGEYWVTVGKGKTGEFHMFESLTAQEAFMAQLREDKDTRDVSSGFGRDTLRKELTKNDASAALKNILDLIADGKAADVDVLEESVLQLYLTALPESDMRRRFIHRSFKTGFSTDLLRTYASTSIASANQLGRLAFNYKFDNLITAGLKETEGRPSKAKLDTITRERALRVKGILSPDPQKTIDWWLSLGSKATFYLLLSAPKSAVVNLLQLPIVGLPTLSAEFGEAATTATMARYMGTFLTGSRMGNPFKDKDGNLKLQTPKFTLENSPYIRELRKTDPTRYGELMKAWRFFEERDVTQSTFTASANIYERSNKPSDKFSFMQSLRRGDTASAAQLAVANTGQLLGASFHTFERIGREIMVMSAFDMAYERAIKQGKTPKDAGKEARELAEKLTSKAMFDFSNWNKSRYAKSRAGRLPLQMRSYSQSMTSLLLRSFVGMIPLQRNKGGKLAAARMFFGVAAMTTLLGGLRASQFYMLALGAYGIYEFVKETFGDDDDEEEKEIEGGYVSEKTIQREMLKFADEKGRELSKKDMDYFIRSVWIPETFGPGGTLANALGLSPEAAAKLAAMADMGLPALGGVDISSSVSLNDLWHSTPSKSDDPEVMFLETLGRTVLGPSAAVPAAFFRFWKEANAGNLDKAVEAVMPAALKNIFKAARLEEEGLVVGKNRDVVLKDPSFYDVYTLALQSAGFTEAGTSRAMQLDIKAGEIEEEVGKQATELLDQRYRAVLEFNKKPTDENLKNWKRVERDITIYNMNFPSNTITEEDKDKSFQSKSKVAGERAYGLGFNPKIPVRQPLAEQRANEMLKDQ
jgi:hypothetical protein